MFFVHLAILGVNPFHPVLLSTPDGLLMDGKIGVNPFHPVLLST
jgi:hypothetical protein